MSGSAFVYPCLNMRFPHSSMKLEEAAASEIANVHGPIVEIGGPTEQGYRLLGDTAIFPSKPLITNVSGFFGNPECVDRLVDGTDMPYDDSSVGMFLASHLSPVDSFKKNSTLVGDLDTEESRNSWDRLSDEEYAISLADPTYKPKYNLRISVLKEMTRTLTANGLVLFEAIGQRDIEVAQAFGHRILQQVSVGGHIVQYDCLFKKER
jgi:hypothetical protein